MTAESANECLLSAARARARGDLSAAINILRSGSQLDPKVRSRLVAALLEIGESDEALSTAHADAARLPSSATTLETLARVWLARHDYTSARDQFLKCAQIRRTLPLGQKSVTVPVPYLLHTLEQVEYLVEHFPGQIPPGIDFAPLAPLRLDLKATAVAAAPDPAFVTVSGMDADRLLRPPLFFPVQAPNQAPLSEAVRWNDTDQALGTGTRSYATLDQILTADALRTLQVFCLAATVWQRPYKYGYVGAFPEDGFIGEIVFAIAADLIRHLPTTLKGMHLAQFWAFSYDPRLPGTDIHGDDSDISLNLWITPNEANLNSSTGGLEIWDHSAPSDWSFSDYNSGGARVRDYLTSQAARSEVIPYAENRGILFRGKLFHRSQSAEFDEGYVNRRRNVTFLFRKVPATPSGIE